MKIMIKKFAYLFLVLFLLGCSKEDVPNYIGTWDGVDYQTITKNGTLDFETSVQFSLEISTSGDGSYSSIIGNNIDTHWVVDEIENEIFILREFQSSSGDEIVTTAQFKIKKDTESEQIWESISSFNNPSTGDVEERLTRWTLTKK